MPVFETDSSELRVATDVGGTFTDLVYYEVDQASGRIAALNTVTSGRAIRSRSGSRPTHNRLRFASVASRNLA